MKTLIKFECIKLLKRKFTTIVFLILLILLILSIAFSIMYINNYNFDNYRGVSSEIILGLKSIKAKKASVPIKEGKLTEEVLFNVLNHYKTIYNNKDNYDNETNYERGDIKYKIYKEEIIPYIYIIDFLNISYTSIESYIIKFHRFDNIYQDNNIYSDKNYNLYNSPYKTNKLLFVNDEMISKLYKIRHKNVEELLNKNILLHKEIFSGLYITSFTYSDADKKFILDKDSKIETPFTYGYMDGWANIFRFEPIYFILITLAICIIIAPIFSYEYQTGTDAIILPTRFGRNKIISAKIIAGFLVSSAIFILTSLFFIIINLLIYGIQGWNASFQLISYYSFFNLTNLQVFLLGLFIEYFVIMSVIAITMWLSSIYERPFFTIIISAFLFFAPIFIHFNKIIINSNFLNHIIVLLPIFSISSRNIFSSYNLYYLGNNIISLPVAIILFQIIIILISLLLTYKCFKKHQVV